MILVWGSARDRDFVTVTYALTRKLMGLDKRKDWCLRGCQNGEKEWPGFKALGLRVTYGIGYPGLPEGLTWGG